MGYVVISTLTCTDVTCAMVCNPVSWSFDEADPILTFDQETMFVTARTNCLSTTPPSLTVHASPTPQHRTADSVSEIYGHRGNVQKSQSYMPLVPGGKGWSVLTCIDKDSHRSKRRLLAAGFSDASLQAFEPRMLEHMRLLRYKLDSGSGTDAHRWSTPKDMSNLCMCSILC